MDSYQQYRKRRSELEMLLVEEREAIALAVLDEVRACVKEFCFSVRDVFPTGRPKKKIVARYLDPNTGATWSGRGREPIWLRGKDRTQYELSDVNKCGAEASVTVHSA